MSQECSSAKFILYWSFSLNVSMMCLSASSSTRIPASHRNTNRKLISSLRVKRRKTCSRSMLVLSWLALCKQYLHGGVLASRSVQPPVASLLLLPSSSPQASPGWVFCSTFRNLWACVLWVLSWKLEERTLVRWRLFFPPHPPTVVWLTWQKVTRAAFVSAVCGWAVLQATALTYLPRKPSRLAGCCAVLLHGCLKRSSILPF